MNPTTACSCLAFLSVGAIASDPPPIRGDILFDGPDRIRISWATQPGEAYFLQTTTNVAQPWQDLQTEPPVLTASTNEFVYELPVASHMQFFRVGWVQSVSGMVLIPGGTFQMGDTFGEGWDKERPVHPVTVSSFYMDQTEVTKSLWDQVRTWALANGYSFGSGAGKAANHPVHTVNWYDVVTWCNARSEREGRIPAYYVGAARTTVCRGGQVEVQNDWVKWNAGYRLPTEAEWEYAARGGLSGKRFPWGDTISHSQANYRSSPAYSYDVSPTRGYHPGFGSAGMPYTSPVGYFTANGYGLYDMAGNVWELCWDRYGDYSSSPAIDPLGPVWGSYRVIRGGGWNRYAIDCRAANRNDSGWPGNMLNYVGFRSVLPSGQ